MFFDLKFVGIYLKKFELNIINIILHKPHYQYRPSHEIHDLRRLYSILEDTCTYEVPRNEK